MALVQQPTIVLSSAPIVDLPFSPEVTSVKTSGYVRLALPDYIDPELFSRLSAYSQGRIVTLLLNPEPAPADYDSTKFAAAGYRSWTHFLIQDILDDAHY